MVWTLYMAHTWLWPWHRIPHFGGINENTSTPVLIAGVLRWQTRFDTMADYDWIAITFENVLKNDCQTHTALHAMFAVDVQTNLFDTMQVHILPNELLDAWHNFFELPVLDNAFQDLRMHAAELGGSTDEIVKLVGVDCENRKLSMKMTLYISRSGGNENLQI
jgi:hypothetical protein